MFASEMTNALVEQKNKIAKMIDDADTADALTVAKSFVEFVGDAFVAYQYTYKILELYRRICDKAKQLRTEMSAYAPGRHLEIEKLTELESI